MIPLWLYIVSCFACFGLGIFIMCLCAISSKAERDMDVIRNQDLDNYLDPDNVI